MGGGAPGCLGGWPCGPGDWEFGVGPMEPLPGLPGYDDCGGPLLPDDPEGPKL